MTTTDHVYAYLRLSRDEADKPGLLEEKFARMRRTAYDLAERHHLNLSDSNILIEQESGRRLRNRPQLLHLMDLMHAGLCSHLIAPFEDRIDRLEDKREQADLEDALYAGCVTVITRDGVQRYDDDLDPLPAEVRALVARHELRLYAKRRREANRQRFKQNQRTSGFAPYGYRRQAEAPGGYETIPAEYAILQEIFRRLMDAEPMRSILRDLQARQVTTPGQGRRRNASNEWDFSTLYDIAHNPFYAGFHARRTRPVRGRGYRLLSPDDYEIPDTPPGAWLCPITLEQHLAIRGRYAEWRRAGRADAALLTGLIHCAAGSPMNAAGANRSYGCHCADETHYANRLRWDQFAERLFRRFVESLPAKVLDRPVDTGPPQDRDALGAQMGRVLRQMAQHEQDVRAMVTDADRQRRLLGDDLYESILLKARREWESVRADADRLRELLDQPDQTEAVSLLRVVRQHGAQAFWQAATQRERRDLLRSIVRRLVLWPTASRRQQHKGLTVEWQPWVTAAGWQVDIPPGWFKVRMEDGRRVYGE